MSRRANKGGGAAAIAAEVVAGTSAHRLDHYVRELSSTSKSAAAQAARVVEEVIALEPTLAAPHIAQLSGLCLSGAEPRVVQACANGLPALARVAPAKVAKQLKRLREGYADASAPAQDGIVRTFAALCAASIAYQPRLIDMLEHALGEADDKTLARWTEAVLPALKGEPYARAREVVEGRLSGLADAPARKIADFLGVRLRPSRAPGG